MADNVLVGDNRVSEGEDGHLAFTLATPDLNLRQVMVEIWFIGMTLPIFMILIRQKVQMLARTPESQIVESQ